jgi:hypothetical protein
LKTAAALAALETEPTTTITEWGAPAPARAESGGNFTVISLGDTEFSAVIRSFFVPLEKMTAVARVSPVPSAVSIATKFHRNHTRVFPWRRR